MSWKNEVEQAKETLLNEINRVEEVLTQSLEVAQVTRTVKAFDELEMLLSYRHFKGEKARYDLYNTLMEKIERDSKVVLEDTDRGNGYSFSHRMIKVTDGAAVLGYLDIPNLKIESKFEQTRQYLNGLEKRIKQYEREKTSYQKDIKEVNIRLQMAEGEKEVKKHEDSLKFLNRHVEMRDTNIRRAQEMMLDRSKLLKECDIHEQKVRKIADRHELRVVSR